MYVRKKDGDGSPLLANKKSIDKLLGMGYEICDGPEEEPDPKAPPVIDPLEGLYPMERGGETSYCSWNQIKGQEERGWKRTDGVKATAVPEPKPEPEPKAPVKKTTKASTPPPPPPPTPEPVKEDSSDSEDDSDDD